MRFLISFITALVVCFVCSCAGKDKTDIPEFSAKQFNSTKVVNLQDFGRGKVTFVNIWSTFCPPCLKETPVLQHLYENYKDNGEVAFMTIAMNREDELRQFCCAADSLNPYRKVFRYAGLTQFDLPTLIGLQRGYKVEVDKENRFSAVFADLSEAEALNKRFGFSAIPTTIIYDRQGKMVYKETEQIRNEKGMKKKIDSLLAL